ncbi:hypothetical protein Z043-119198 [Arapaima gigas]
MLAFGGGCAPSPHISAREVGPVAQLGFGPAPPTGSFTPSIGGILPMFLVLAFMYSVSAIIKGLVLEKELRLKEVLRAVGVRNGALWCAWFIENMVLLAVPCALISVMVKVSGDATGRSRSPHYKALQGQGLDRLGWAATLTGGALGCLDVGAKA